MFRSARDASCLPTPPEPPSMLGSVHLARPTHEERMRSRWSYPTRRCRRSRSGAGKNSRSGRSVRSGAGAGPPSRPLAWPRSQGAEAARLRSPATALQSLRSRGTDIRNDFLVPCQRRRKLPRTLVARRGFEKRRGHTRRLRADENTSSKLGCVTREPW